MHAKNQSADNYDSIVQDSQVITKLKTKTNPGISSGRAPSLQPQQPARPIKFSLKDGSPGALMHYFVKALSPPRAEYFDAFTVLAVPTALESAIIGEKVMHSVVLLVESRTGHGVMMEYLSNDFGCVSCSHGILAAAGDNQGSGALHPFQFVSKGFYKCPHITPARVLEFVEVFETMSKFDVLNHNCHIFHRSLVASLLRQKLLYNLRSPKQANALKATTTSQLFHEIGGQYKTSEQVVANHFSKANLSCVHTFHLTDLVKTVSDPVTVQTIKYLPNSHAVLLSDFGTISVSFRFLKASENFQAALASGRRSLLKNAIQECVRYKLTNLAEIGESVLLCIGNMNDALASNDRNCILNALSAAKQIENKLVEHSMNGGLSSFEAYVKIVEREHTYETEIREAKKLLNWSMLNGNVELLTAATAACSRHDLTAEYERGTKALRVIKELTNALESNSKVSLILAVAGAEPYKDCVSNFWIYKKCTLAVKDNRSMITLSYRYKTLVILLIIVVASIVIGIYS
jgi:hypothetical protein